MRSPTILQLQYPEFHLSPCYWPECTLQCWSMYILDSHVALNTSSDQSSHSSMLFLTSCYQMRNATKKTITSPWIHFTVRGRVRVTSGPPSIHKFQTHNVAGIALPLFINWIWMANFSFCAAAEERTFFLSLLSHACGCDLFFLKPLLK